MVYINIYFCKATTSNFLLITNVNNNIAVTRIPIPARIAGGRRITYRSRHISLDAFIASVPLKELHRIRKALAGHDIFLKLWEEQVLLYRRAGFYTNQRDRNRAERLRSRISADCQRRLMARPVDLEEDLRDPIHFMRLRAEYFERCRAILSLRNGDQGTGQPESWSYPQLQDFFLYVGTFIQEHFIELSTRYNIIAKGPEHANEKPGRVLLPHVVNDRTPRDSDYGSRIDILLTMMEYDHLIEALDMPPTREEVEEANREGRNRPDGAYLYVNAFAVMEVKAVNNQTEKDNAYVQLLDYLRHIYACQYDRRLVWGMICCGTVINVCTFEPDRALATPNMDITTFEGRDEFFRFLVNWSLCGYARLGYDTSMSYENERWYAKVFNNRDRRTERTFDVAPRYHLLGLDKTSTALFGKHTRCFRARRVVAGNEVGDEVIIKDTWYNDDTSLRQGRRQANRSEPALLSRFAENPLPPALDADGNPRPRYPTVLASGTVRQLELGRVMLDISENTFPNGHATNYDDGRRVPPRKHNRMVISPAGLPLLKADSVQEAIVGIVDTIEDLIAIHRRHQVLHTDISPENIVLTRVGNQLRGLLIDYGNVLLPTDEERLHAHEETGSIPFLCIRDLEDLGRPPNLLDTWESLLYMVCWIGTYGFGEWRLAEALKDDLPIANWVNLWSIEKRHVANRGFLRRAFKEMGVRKRYHLSSGLTFQEEILDNFNRGNNIPYADMLRELALNIYNLLFQYGRIRDTVDGYVRGTAHFNPPPIVNYPEVAEERAQDAAIRGDPIARRQRQADIDEINQALLQHVREVRERALPVARRLREEADAQRRR